MSDKKIILSNEELGKAHGGETTPAGASNDEILKKAQEEMLKAAKDACNEVLDLPG